MENDDVPGVERMQQPVAAVSGEEVAVWGGGGVRNSAQTAWEGGDERRRWRCPQGGHDAEGWQQRITGMDTASSWLY